jgi:membrane associated rhomboid family serine protease
MGIYDREYIRFGARSPSGLGNLRFVSVNTWLIAANIAIYLLQIPLPDRYRFPSGAGVDAVFAYGHLSTLTAIKYLEVWRLVSFQFLHASPIHLGFNMLGLWMFGSLVEQFLGAKRYAAFYLTSGIAGGLLFLVLNLLGHLGLQLPGVLYDQSWIPLVGASAGVFGVIMACAFIEPRAVVDLYGIIPIPMRVFAYGYVALAALNLLRGGTNAGGDAAHLGGAIAGYFFIRHSHLLHDFFDIFDRSPSPSSPSSEPRDSQSLDRILAKIKSDGLASLSESERRLLRRATLRRTGTGEG